MISCRQAARAEQVQVSGGSRTSSTERSYQDCWNGTEPQICLVPGKGVARRRRLLQRAHAIDLDVPGGVAHYTVKLRALEVDGGCSLLLDAGRVGSPISDLFVGKELGLSELGLAPAVLVGEIMQSATMYWWQCSINGWRETRGMCRRPPARSSLLHLLAVLARV